MNKKYLMFGILGLFAIGIVSATIGYYAMFSTTLVIEESITLSGCEDTIEDVFDGDTVVGEECIITNNAPSERSLIFSNNAPEGIVTSYIGNLVLTKKDTEWNATGEPISIDYTVIGEDFEVTGVPEGYTAIYYKDAVIELGERVSNPQSAISIVGVGNLPHANDANWDELANYGEDPDNYNQHKGAKLWVVPNEDLDGLVLDWDNMINYYYETDMIQYNAEGNIVLSPESELVVRPVYEIGAGVTGEHIVETTIA